MQESIDYIKDLFEHSKLKVSEGKRVQRKVRYEKLKGDFQALLVQLSKQTQPEEKLEANNDDYNELRETLWRERQEHGKKIEQYKEQVARMRENIDLFKENVSFLKKQNEDLEMKISEDRAPELEALFVGLKEDNAALGGEVRRLQEENFRL